MLQRIQTFFLLLALGCMSAFFFFPVARIILPDSEILSFHFNGIEGNHNIAGTYSTLPYMILLIIITLLSLITIFLYKKRMLQIRLCIFNIILMLGFIGLSYYYVTDIVKELHADQNYTILMVFPLAAAILSFLALRAIGRDEALVRSVDRLR